MLPSFTPSHPSLPPLPSICFSRRAPGPLLLIILQFHSGNLHLALSNSKTCNAVLNWDVQRCGELKDQPWQVGLKVRVACVAACCDLHIKQMLSERGKKNPVLLTLQQMQIFVRLSPKCKHSFCSYWNKNIIFKYGNWTAHSWIVHAHNTSPNKKGLKPRRGLPGAAVLLL